MQVARGFDLADAVVNRGPHGRRARVRADERLLGPPESHWNLGHGADADSEAPARPVRIERELRGRRSEGKVAAPRVDLVKAGPDPATPYRKAHGGETGGGGQGGRHRSGEEIRGSNLRGLRRGAETQRCVERHRT